MLGGNKLSSCGLPKEVADEVVSDRAYSKNNIKLLLQVGIPLIFPQKKSVVSRVGKSFLSVSKARSSCARSSMLRVQPLLSMYLSCDDSFETSIYSKNN